MSLRIAALAVGLVLASAAPAAAQNTAARPRWEVEGYAGMTFVNRSSSGDVTLPPPGAPILTTGPLSPSRETPTWFIGDGAALLNSVNAGFGIAELVTPLDPVVPMLGRGSSQSAVIGARLRRTLRPRLDLEFAADIAPASARLPDEVAANIEATRTTYDAAWRALLGSGFLTNVSVTTTSATSGGGSRDATVTGALNWRFAVDRRTSWYVTGGGGLITGLGDAGTITLDGHYRFVAADAAGQVAFDEADHVELRVESATTFVGVAGGGMRRSFSASWALQFDVRVLVGEHSTRVRLDATPAVVVAAPGGYIEAGGIGPTIQFSNDPATGRRSSLSAAPLEDFEAFRGDGLQVRTLLTVGIVKRF